MSRSDEAALQAARTYQDYLVPAIFEPWAHVLIQHAGLRAGECVLDVACGTGIVARHAAAEVGPDGTVDALDLNPTMIAVGRSLPAPAGARITWNEGSVLALPFSDTTFDLVLCQQGLQFFPDAVLALQEMRRVLVPGGRVTLSVWQSIEQQPVYHELNEAIKRRIGTPAFAAPFALGDADTLSALLRAAGFARVEVVEKTRTVRFPSPERFVELSVLGAAAAVPAFAQMDGETRTALVESVRSDVSAFLQSHTQDDMLVETLAAHIGIGGR